MQIGIETLFQQPCAEVNIKASLPLTISVMAVWHCPWGLWKQTRGKVSDSTLFGTLRAWRRSRWSLFTPSSTMLTSCLKHLSSSSSSGSPNLSFSWVGLVGWWLARDCCTVSVRDIIFWDSCRTIEVASCGATSETSLGFLLEEGPTCSGKALLLTVGVCTWGPMWVWSWSNLPLCWFSSRIPQYAPVSSSSEESEIEASER